MLMHTITCTQPGQLSFEPAPLPPGAPGQSLLRIIATGICGTDVHAYSGQQPFFTYPRILGHELAAEVVQTDREGFTPGDVVTISPYFYCRQCIACRRGLPNCCRHISVFGVHQDGGMRQQVWVPSYSLVHGHGLAPEVLALIEPLAIGEHGVRRAAVQAGEYVLIMGAGPIGMAAAMAAMARGAEVILMDINTWRLDFAQQLLGVPYILQSTTPNLVAQLGSITQGDMPTVVIDASGNRQAILHGFEWAAHGARYVLVGLQKEAISFSHPEFHKREMTLMSSRNATALDFENVMQGVLAKKLQPQHLITHRVSAFSPQDVVAALEAKDKTIMKSMLLW